MTSVKEKHEISILFKKFSLVVFRYSPDSSDLSEKAKAWTIKWNSSAPDASAIIHTDFKKGFICAETTSYEDYIKYGGSKGAKENGKIRQEGKEYLIKDGDVVHFLFNV